MIISTIESIAFPIITFTISILIIIYLIKKEEKRQLSNDKHYEELTNKFIDTIKKISDENNKTLKDISNSIQNIMDKFEEPKRDK